MTSHFVSEMAGGAAAFRVFFLSRRSSNAFGPAHWCDSCKSARREIGFIHDASIGEDVGVSKNRGRTTKMDGENNGTPYEQMDDLGGFNHPYFWFNTHVLSKIQDF